MPKDDLNVHVFEKKLMYLTKDLTRERKQPPVGIL